MSPASLSSALLVGHDPGFTVAVGAGIALLACAGIVTVRELQGATRLSVIAPCVLGAVGVASQLAVARSAPASRTGFLLGTLGGWCWYVGWLRSERYRLSEQGLAVGGLLWIGGTITLAVSFSGPRWPIRWSIAVGVAAAVGAGVMYRSRDLTGAPWGELQYITPVAVAFVGPAVVGFLFSPNLLFVLFLVSTVSVIIGWSHRRLAQAR